MKEPKFLPVHPIVVEASISRQARLVLFLCNWKNTQHYKSEAEEWSQHSIYASILRTFRVSKGWIRSHLYSSVRVENMVKYSKWHADILNNTNSKEKEDKKRRLGRDRTECYYWITCSFVTDGCCLTLVAIHYFEALVINLSSMKKKIFSCSELLV